MATLANANLPSSDEEDIDFVPEEASSDEEGGNKKRTTKKRKRVRGIVTVAEENDEIEAYQDSGPLKTKPVSERTMMEKKAKLNDLWTKLNEDSKKKEGINLALLCKPVKNQSKSTSKDESWMRHLGLAPPSGGQSRTSDPKAAAATALAAAKNAASISAAQQYGMVTVTENRRFAGKTITMQRQVEASSKAAGAHGEEAGSDAAARKKAGLDAVLESLAQAKKITVLDKSRSDWKHFKKADEAVEEELEAHKRSGTTYLEKQEFLGRAELAEYERERDQRLASDVRNRGRL